MWGYIYAFYFLTSFYPPRKISPLLNPKLCFDLEGSRKDVHFWRWIESLPYCRILQMASLVFFHLLPLIIACRVLWNVPEILRIVVCQIGPVFLTNHGVPGIPTRWTCATQPGLPPPCAQFRFGNWIDWTSFFISRFRWVFWCERTGFLTIKSFDLEFGLLGLRSLYTFSIDGVLMKWYREIRPLRKHQTDF